MLVRLCQLVVVSLALVACGSSDAQRAAVSQSQRPAVSQAQVGTEAPTATAPAPSLNPSSTFMAVESEPAQPVLEQYSLRTGRPLRQLARLPADIANAAIGLSGNVWLTASSGPIEQNDTAGGDPKPDSCTANIERLNLDTGTATDMRTFPDSVWVREGVPSPNERLLVETVAPCARSYFNEHLLVEELATGRQWAIGALTPVCHFFAPPSWNPAGTSLVFAYHPPDLSSPATSGDGYGVCKESLPGKIAIVGAGRASELAGAHLFAAPKGCGYQSAVFDHEGVAATEACEQGTAPGFRFPGGDDGDAYVVQLNLRGRVLRRFGIRREPNPTRVAVSDFGGPVLVTEQLGENTRPYWDWIWAFNGKRLRLIRHSRQPVRALPD
jgi:hypothetical protein